MEYRCKICNKPGKVMTENLENGTVRIACPTMHICDVPMQREEKEEAPKPKKAKKVKEDAGAPGNP